MDEKELNGKTSNYGEFVTSYFCWLGMDEQRKRAEELQKPEKLLQQPGIPRPASRLFRRIPGSQHDKRRAVCHSVHQHLLRCTGYFLPQGPIANAGPAL